MIETEVKLLAPQGVLRELAQSPLFAESAAGKRRKSRTKPELLESRYYDTADRALQRSGCRCGCARSAGGIARL
jgi:inorganic triphosphatase YgiF